MRAPLLAGVRLCAGLAIVAGCDDPVTAPPGEPTASVVINEFLASNDETRFDEDGDASDWIELYNAGPGSADLVGWALTDDADDLRAWTFPSVTLEAGAYLLVFASGKDRSDASSELHTSFRLSSGGEYLALVRPDGTTIEDQFSPEYPPQDSDISFGRLPGGGVGFLRSPTPGGPNSPQALGQVEFSVASGLFVGEATVTLTEPSGAGTIHYTVDGSKPDASSPVATGALRITETTRVRARAFDGQFSGREGYAFYTAMDSVTATFASDLPLVVVHTFGSAVPDNGDGVESAMYVFEPSGSSTSLIGTPRYAGGTSIDIRGNSSAEFPKKQYKLELHDAEGDDIDADLLGLGLEEDWILYAPGHYDRNMIANPLMQRLAGRVGLTEVGMRFVEVFLSQDGGPVTMEDYAGLYVLSENIKIDETRVDLAELDVGDNAPPDVTGGYLLKLGRQDPDEYGFRTPSGFPDEDRKVVVVRPKLRDLTSAQQDYIRGYFTDFDNALRGPQSADPSNGYRAFIDVRSWIDAHILRLIAKDADHLLYSHYLVKDRNELLASGPLWDFDRSLGSWDWRVIVPDENDTGTPPFRYEWWGLLFSDPAFAAEYQARWAELRAGVLSNGAIFSDIDQLAAQVANAYPRENERWGSTEGYGSRFGDFAGEIAWTKSWLTTRLTFLDQIITSGSF